jgi:hypothetical protein
MYHSISTNAEDAGSWGSRVTTTLPTADTVTYQQLHRLTSEGTGVGRIYRIYRNQSAGRHNWSYYQSDNDGVTWTGPTLLYDDSTNHFFPYMVSTDNETNRIDVLFSDDGPNVLITSGVRILHAYYDGTWRKSDGTATTLPLDPSKMTVVYDSTSDSKTVWVSNITLDGSGNPHALWYRMPEPPGGGSHELYYSKWTGSAWTAVKMLDEGDGLGDPQVNEWYPGVATFDPEDVTTVWVSKEETKYEIQRWTTIDSGATWSKAEDLTTGSNNDNGRPIGIRNRASDFKVVWWGNGDYRGLDFTFFAYLISDNDVWNVEMWSAHYARFEADSIGSVDSNFYVYYDNSVAVDAQNKANTWGSISSLQNVHHLLGTEPYVTIPDDSGNSRDTEISAFNVSADNSDKFTAGYLNYDTGQDRLFLDFAGLDYASQTDVTIIVFGRWELNASGETQIVGSDEGGNTIANINVRIEQSNNSLEMFTLREPDAFTGATIGGGIAGNPGEAYRQFTILFDHDGVGGKVWYARVDKTEGTSSITSGAALDAGSSANERLGKNTTDYWRGPVSFVLIAFSQLSKDWTDTHHTMMTDGGFTVLGPKEIFDESSSVSSVSSLSSSSISTSSASSISTSSSTGILEYPNSKSVSGSGPASKTLTASGPATKTLTASGPASATVTNPV